MPRQYFNNAGSTLAANISDSATTMEVVNAATRLGTPTPGNPIRFVLEQGASIEIVEATSLTGNVYTITRAVERVMPDAVATAYAFTEGAIVEVRTTASSLSGTVGFVPSWFGDGHVFAHSCVMDGGAFTNIGSIAIVSMGASDSGAGQSATSYFTRQFRRVNTSAATANSVCGWRSSVQGVMLGTYPWFWAARWGIADTSLVSTARTCIGFVTGVAAETDVEPSTRTSCIFFGHDSADTNLQVMHNDSTGTCTKVDLGSNFPINTASTDWYHTEFRARADGTIQYWVRRMNTGHTTSGILSTNLPSNTVLLSMKEFRSNGSTAAAVSLAMGFRTLVANPAFSEF